MRPRQRNALWAALVAAAVLAAVAASGGGGGVFQVKWVADGDTVLLTDGRWVRYIGINTPEVVTKDHPEEPLGPAARKRNRALIDGRPVRLQFDRSLQDRYNRTLAYVTDHRGQMINETLTAEGLAYCLPFRPNDRYTDRLLAAQRKAMAARRGLWSLLTATAGSVTGNRKSRRFHHPDCPYGRNISSKNRRSFKTAREAFHAGYAPDKQCLPAAVLFSVHP